MLKPKKPGHPHKSLHIVALLLLLSEVGIYALLSPFHMKTFLLFGGGLGLAMIFDIGGLLLSLPLLFPLLMGHTPYVWGALFLVQGLLALSLRRSMRSVDELASRYAQEGNRASLSKKDEPKDVRELQGQCSHLSQQLQEQKTELLQCRREFFRVEGELVLRDKQKLMQEPTDHEVIRHLSDLEAENQRLEQEVKDLETLIQKLSHPQV